jgi:hypothetical protein
VERPFFARRTFERVYLQRELQKQIETGFFGGLKLHDENIYEWFVMRGDEF